MVPSPPRPLARLDPLVLPLVLLLAPALRVREALAAPLRYDELYALAAHGAWRWSQSGRERDGAPFVAGGGTPAPPR